MATRQESLNRCPQIAEKFSQQKFPLVADDQLSFFVDNYLEQQHQQGLPPQSLDILLSALKAIPPESRRTNVAAFAVGVLVFEGGFAQFVEKTKTETPLIALQQTVQEWSRDAQGGTLRMIFNFLTEKESDQPYDLFNFRQGGGPWRQVIMAGLKDGVLRLRRVTKAVYLDPTIRDLFYPDGWERRFRHSLNWRPASGRK